MKCDLYHTVPLRDLKIHKNMHSPWASSSTPPQVSFSSVKICSGLCGCVHACWVHVWTHLGLSFWVEFLKQSPSFLSFPFHIGELDWDQSASADFSFISQAGESVRLWNGLFKGADLFWWKTGILKQNEGVGHCKQTNCFLLIMGYSCSLQWRTISFIPRPFINYQEGTME